MRVLLRRATRDDIPTLKRWDEAPHVQAAGGDDDWWDWDAEIDGDHPFVEHLMAEWNGRSIGLVQIIDPANEETHYWGACEQNLRAIDIWIGETDCLGQGLGTEMMRLAIDKCFAERDVIAIVIDPLANNLDAHRFYQRLGFCPIMAHRFERDLCLVHRLDRVNWKTPAPPS